MLDRAIKDIHHRDSLGDTIDEEDRWDMVVATIKESQASQQYHVSPACYL